MEQLKYIHAVYDLAEECGDVSDSSYEAWKALKDEMQSGVKKVENGEVVYGLKEYTFSDLFQYEMSTLKEKYGEMMIPVRAWN